MHPLVALAQQAVAYFVKQQSILPTPTDGYSDFQQQQAGVFVTLKTPESNLRGCMGTLTPVYQNILEETIRNAISAAHRDPRFSPVTASELMGLQYSVSILHPPEPVHSLEQLNPLIYGVIVTARERRGLLLPELEGINTPEKQVHHAILKAGLRPGEPVNLQRFQVDKYT